jgi:hypothetical protein
MKTPPSACHAQIGVCEGGVCIYAPVDDAGCDDGDPCTVADTCAGGVCAGTPKSCTTPPAAVCIASSTLRTYDGVGACTGGLCVYTHHDAACGQGGCTGSTCATDACAGVTCMSPPSVCYAPSGTCAGGSCSYAFADGASCDDHNACTTADSCAAGTCKGVPKTCATPPANTCQDATTAKIYAAVGACSAGACSYTYSYVSCPTGCSAGACNASGWSLMTSNVTSNLYAVWGSSASAVWAGGETGLLAYYNGAIWQARPSPTTDNISGITGSGASDVFLSSVGSGGLYHYDGSAWARVTAFSGFVLAMASVGPNDVLVLTSVQNISNMTVYELRRYTNGARVTGYGGQFTAYPFSGFSGYRYGLTMWALSPTDVYLPSLPAQHFDGTTFGPIGTFKPAASVIWARDPTHVYMEDGWAYQLVEGAWNDLGVRPAGGLSSVWGTPAGLYAVGTTTAGGAVFYFDGVGWTIPTIPSTTHGFTAVWIAASGQVFVVGGHGTILTGP